MQRETETMRPLTVVLDDDPTGTQSAAGVTVLLSWSAQEIAEVLRAESAVYLQTNSRAVPEEEAVRLTRRTRADVEGAERELGRPILVVLRGDSTLRGHVFAESDVFVHDAAAILFVPAFPDGGRTTIESVHRVVVRGVDTPAAETEFADDPVFGFRSSNLLDWVREKGGRGATPVPLEQLRATNGTAVAELLGSVAPGEVVVPDVADNDDIRLVHRGLLEALTAGLSVVLRTAAPLAALCAGHLSDGVLARPITAAHGPILLVCGSHTDAATRQLSRLTSVTGVAPVTISTEAAIADPDDAARAAVQELKRELERGNLAILASERIRAADHDSLQHGERVMAAIIAAARQAAPSAGVVVSKGGITSAEVARHLFGTQRARVAGQLTVGISVWTFDRADPGPRFQIVVPGNVGDDDALIDVLDALPTAA